MKTAFIALLFLLSLGCARRDASAPPPENRSAARQAGHVAHDVAKDAGRAARAAGRKIGQAAHEAREGWKEAAREDRAKAPRK